MKHTEHIDALGSEANVEAFFHKKVEPPNDDTNEPIYERELKRSDGTVYAVERDHKLCCGHIERGVPGKIPYHRGIGLYCGKCEAWVTLLANWVTAQPSPVLPKA